MPRREIPFAPDVYYHIYNRGNNREAIFFEPDNYLYFLKKVKKYLVPVADVLVYCLMPTHYHIVAKVCQTSEVSLAMMKLSVSYTKAINKKFQRVGVLFQGQFQAKPVVNSTYLLNLCRYIHANPVKDGIVADISQWQYSNYLEWIGERDGTLVNREFIAEYFDSSADYRKFVSDYLKSRQLPEDVRIYLDSLEK
ncbi:MAG: transposase [Chloroflexi bacterium]|nr:transposase [Chloroflexota bacterium]